MSAAAPDYAQVFEAAGVGMVLVAFRGTLLRANMRFCELVGRSEAELKALTVAEITHPDDYRIAADYLERMVRGELDTVSMDLRVLTPDGGVVWLNVQSRVLRGPAREPLHVVAVAHDVGERRDADQALRQRTAELTAANDMLVAAARYKDQFLASMSHELRTPLNAILGLAEALVEDVHGELNSRQRRSMNLVADSGRHLLRLINDLLDLSKVEAGMLQLQREVVAVEDVCAASLRAVRELAATRKQQLSYHQSDATLLLTADPQRLRHVLTILLSNAVKFTGDQGSIGIDVTLAREREVVEITVWDDGIGIDAEELPRLFKPFVQLDGGLSRQYGGLGLGLVLAHRLVALHGGSISVSSERGKGSRFTVALPWRPAAAASLAPREATWRSPRVLVIEDSPVASADLQEQLERFGARVWLHDTLTGAFERVLELEPHLVILDVYLPDGSGWTLLSRIRADARTRALPVVVSSAVEDRQTAALMGATEYLSKPARASELEVLLDYALPGSISGRALPAAAPSLPPSVRQSRPIVLCADDNELNALVVREYLESVGYRVEVASDGRQAVELARLLKPAVILMDVQMPVIDGIQAMQQIRALGDEHSGRVPIVALTGLAMPGDRERCLTAGASDYRVKPIVLPLLRQIVDSLVR